MRLLYIRIVPEASARNASSPPKAETLTGYASSDDASSHRWFFNDREFSLHGAIDDATSEILALFFTPNECLDGHFEVIRTIATNHGLPMAIYADRHTIFRSPHANRLSPEDELMGVKVKNTQFRGLVRTLDHPFSGDIFTEH